MSTTENSHENIIDISMPEVDVIPGGVPVGNIEFLQGLIESFNTSAQKLKETYDSLKDRFDAVNIKLEETNLNLTESLTEQERLSNYMTNILESLSSGVLVVGLDGNITLFNHGAEGITGISSEDALGMPYREVMGADVPEDLTPLSTLASGEGRFHSEKTLKSSRGGEIPVGFSLSPLVNKDREMIGVVEVFMDMSRIKSLEDELARKEKLAALGQMAATMAHKIRNPLGGIAGFAGLLRLDLRGNDNGSRLVGKISEGVDKLNLIITSLISYTSKLSLAKRTFPLGALLENVIAEVKNKTDNEGCIFDFHLGMPEGELTVNADTERVCGVIKSILLNAVDAMETGGTIDVALISGNSAVEPSNPMTHTLLNTVRSSSKLLNSPVPAVLVMITDSGCGMSGEVKRNLFMPFYTTKENGIGLGLAAARKIIEEHRGEIWIESKEDKGTAIGILLPEF